MAKCGYEKKEKEEKVITQGKHMGKRTNGFDKDPERAREAGKKGKRKSFDTMLTELAEQISESNPDKSNIQCINEALIARAMKGDMKAIELVLNRTEGTPTQRILKGNMNPQDNPLYLQMKAILESHKKKG